MFQSRVCRRIIKALKFKLDAANMIKLCRYEFVRIKEDRKI